MLTAGPVRLQLRTGLLFIVTAILLRDARAADTHGLVVRVDTGAPVEGAVVAHLAAGGKVTDVTLKDDGNPPDPVGSDQSYSGAVWLEGDTFTVSVSLGDRSLEGGPVSWASTDSARDLSIRVSGGALTVEAGLPGGGSDAPPPDAGAAAPPGGTPPAPGGTPASEGASSAPGAGTPGAVTPVPPRARSTASSGGAGLYIGFGVGVLALVGILWAWSRTRGGASTAGALTPLPEPGILGSGTPSLTDGLSVWVVDAADAPALTGALLATLARFHRVLYVGPARDTPPPVHGGPVFRALTGRPSHVGDTVEAMATSGGAAVAVLISGVGLERPAMQEFADMLPTGVGAILVTDDPRGVTVTTIRCRRGPDGWVIEGKEGALTVRAGALGLEPVTG